MYQTPRLFVTHHIDEALYMGQKNIIMDNNPDKIVKAISHPLFKNLSFKEESIYGDLIHKVQGIIRKGAGDETL